MSSSRRVVADGTLLLVACVWGATFPLAKVILRYLPPFAYLAIRFGAAVLFLLPFALSRRPGARTSEHSESGSNPPGAPWTVVLRRSPWPWAAGFALAGGYVFQTLGLRTAGATASAFITGLSVVLVPVFGAFWGRRPRVVEAAGVLAALAGLALLTLRGPAAPGRGELLVLACAVCFAWHILFLDRAARTMAASSLGVLQTAAVALVSAAFIGSEPAPERVPVPVLVAVLAMAAGASAAAFTIQAWAQRFTTPTHVGLIFASEPVAAALFAAIWLGERLGAGQWAGSALIIAGIVAAELPERVTLRTRRSSRSRTP